MHRDDRSPTRFGKTNFICIIMCPRVPEKDALCLPRLRPPANYVREGFRDHASAAV